MVKDAEFMDNGRHRMYLSRIWDERKPLNLFIGINPSTADAYKDDATITRLIGFCKKWGDGGFYIVNLYSYMSKDVTDLLSVKYPSHKLNDHYIGWAARKCDKVIFMWGNKKFSYSREEEVVPKFPYAYCFGHTKNKKPKHPLYLHRNTKLIYYL